MHSQWHFFSLFIWREDPWVFKKVFRNIAVALKLPLKNYMVCLCQFYKLINLLLCQIFHLSFWFHDSIREECVGGLGALVNHLWINWWTQFVVFSLNIVDPYLCIGYLKWGLIYNAYDWSRYINKQKICCNQIILNNIFILMICFLYFLARCLSILLIVLKRIICFSWLFLLLFCFQLNLFLFFITLFFLLPLSLFCISFPSHFR